MQQRPGTLLKGVHSCSWSCNTFHFASSAPRWSCSPAAVTHIRAAVAWAGAPWLAVSRLGPAQLGLSVPHVTLALWLVLLSLHILTLELPGFTAREAHGGFCQVFSSPDITMNIFVIFSPSKEMCSPSVCSYKHSAML